MSGLTEQELVEQILIRAQLLNDMRMISGALIGPQQGFQSYVGTKVINARPMTRYAYNVLRNWALPAGENPQDEGYLVEYTDQIETPPINPGFQGYISWSPKDVFERAYRAVSAAAPAGGQTEGVGGKAKPADIQAIEDFEKSQRIIPADGTSEQATVTTTITTSTTGSSSVVQQQQQFQGRGHH